MLLMIFRCVSYDLLLIGNRVLVVFTAFLFCLVMMVD